MKLSVVTILLTVVLFSTSVSVTGQEKTADVPLDLRMEQFTVPPATGPVIGVQVRNRGEDTFSGKVRPVFPEGWQWSPRERSIVLEPGKTARLPFTIEKAVQTAANAYPVKMIAASNDKEISRVQTIVCASAPYFEPKIDGNLKDWNDAIPITFIKEGKKTVVRTFWTKKYFFVSLEVQEDKLIGYHRKNLAEGIDAVQFALSPRQSVTGTTPLTRASRYEFLIADSASIWSKDKCYLLIHPEMNLVESQQIRSLADLEFKDARVAVKRKKDVTFYECVVPFDVLTGIRPGVGREICFSFLVHDPDGTGVRDWGRVAGLWPDQRTPLAWCAWEGVKWDRKMLYDNKLEWGLCSSKH